MLYWAIYPHLNNLNRQEISVESLHAEKPQIIKSLYKSPPIKRVMIKDSTSTNSSYNLEPSSTIKKKFCLHCGSSSLAKDGYCLDCGEEVIN